MLKTLLIGILLLLPTVADAAIDAFLKIDGVPGESQNANHQNEIEVLSFAWGVAPNDARKPVTCPTTFTINKLFDAASPPLALAALTKQRLGDARLTVERAGAEATEFDFLTITLGNVGVSRYQTGGSESDSALTESVELSFSTVTVEYTPQDSMGNAGTPKTLPYDVTKLCLKN